jgi:hypothetical protein
MRKATTPTTRINTARARGFISAAAHLIDWSGNDTYTAGHICQGAAHDYAVGILIDRAGDDKYSGDTTAQGSAINNSFAMLLDRSGNDSTRARIPNNRKPPATMATSASTVRWR